MALTKIPSSLIEQANQSITSSMIEDTLDLTSKTVSVATATAGDNDTTVASTAFVASALAALVDSSPTTLDTLNELAAALGDDPNFATTTATSLGLKAPLASPVFTGTIQANGLAIAGNLNLTGLLALTGTRGTFIDSSENSTIPNIFATNDAVGDFSQEAGHLVIQPRVHTSVYRDIIFAGGINNAKRLMTIQGEGDISFYESTGTTAKLFWDASSESLSIGTNGSTTDRRFQVSGSAASTATTQFGIVANPTYPTNVTGDVYNLYSQPNVASGTTLTSLYNLYLGATGLSGSTITNLYGVYQAGASEKNYFAGNVGIGTTAPGYNLHVEKLSASENVDLLVRNTGTDGTSNSRIMSYVSGASGGDPKIGLGVTGVRDYFFRIDNSDSDKLKLDTNGTDIVTIDNSGNVGIGTSSPTANLSVGSTTTATGDVTLRTTKTTFSITPSNTDAGGVELGVGWVAGGQGPMKFSVGTEKMRIDSVGTTTIKTDGTTQLVLNRADASIQSGNQVAQLLVTGDDPSAGQSGAAISFIAGDAWTTNSYPTNIVFSNDLSGTLTERMRINSSGNLLVGTTSSLNGSNFQVSAGSGASSTPYASVFNTAVSPTSAASTRFDLGFLSGASNYVATNTVLGSFNFMGQANDDGYGGAYIKAVVTSGGNTSRAAGHSVNLEFATKNTTSAGATTKMTLDSSGNLYVSGNLQPAGNIIAPSVYANYTGGSPNLVMYSGGIIQRTGSSLRYKNTINDATHGLAELLTLRPVTYKGNNDGDTIFGGLIAEEVHDAGLTEFVQYGEEGEPDGLGYGSMVSLCIKAIQEQQAIIESLTARIAALE